MVDQILAAKENIKLIYNSAEAKDFNGALHNAVMLACNAIVILESCYQEMLSQTRKERK
jgi:hypothetical protein